MAKWLEAHQGHLPLPVHRKAIFASFLCSSVETRSNQSILKEINPEYSLERLRLKLQYFVHLMQRANSLEKTLMLRKIEGRRRKGQQKMRWFGWYHRVNGHEFEQSLEDSEGQGSLVCCSAWGCRVGCNLATEQ